MSAATAIVSNQLGCQLKPKVFDGHLGAFAGVILHQNERIGDGYIQ
jgi:hypothetical protein